MAPQVGHAESAQQAAQRILSNKNYQRNLPNGDTAKPKKVERRPVPVNWSKGSAPIVRGPSAGFSLLVTYIFWGLGLIVVVGLIFWIVREVALRRSGAAVTLKTPKSEVEADPVLDAPKEDVVLRDAEALAASGLFGEAVHALLLRAIEILKSVKTVPDSLTSRELATLVRLSGSRRSAFYEMLTTAERAHFGGIAMGADDFSACATAYRVFVEHRP